MSRLSEYRIPFLGLKEGSHAFSFRLNDEFFERFEFSEVTKGDVRVEVVMLKQSTMLDLEFELEGTAELPCDRCGSDTTVHFTGSERLIVKMGDETGPRDEEILVLGPNEHELDLEQFLFEYVELNLPARRVHEDPKDCDQDALKKLSELEIKDDDDSTDPRWDALRGIDLQ